MNSIAKVEGGNCPRLLLELFHSALQAVAGGGCTQRALTAQPPAGPVTVVALGKAAQSMLAGAQAVLGKQLQRALLITKNGYASPSTSAPVEVIEAGHPLPDAASLHAGERLQQLLAELPPDHQLLILLSGGTSSLVEALPDGMTLADLQALNTWLLGSGLPITAINAIRARVSTIKGGRLLSVVPPVRTQVLMISDVPGDDPSLIGSGLFHPAAKLAPLPPLPQPWQDLLDRVGSTPPSASNTQLDTRIIASLDVALQAVSTAAADRGIRVHRHGRRLCGDAEQTGRALATYLRAAPSGLHLWGGETTVMLPPEAGQGGRCQQLALAAALGLEGTQGIHLLAAATDGSDGPTDTAGACVHGGTCAAGRAAGLDPGTALRQADAGSFLAVCSALLDTGPTGSNVTDLVIAQVADAL